MSQATFVCIDCDTEFPRTGRNQKRCTECNRVNNRGKSYRHRVASGSIKKPGVGKGGGQGKGPSHHSYRNGIGAFLKARREYKERLNACERCHTSLAAADRYGWCLHHRDHDRNNNPLDGSNWELLCKRCHQNHHHPHRDSEGKYIQEMKVQRLSRRGVRTRVRKRTTPQRVR